jgi:hypothetical protein
MVTVKARGVIHISYMSSFQHVHPYDFYLDLIVSENNLVNYGDSDEHMVFNRTKVALLRDCSN